MSRNLIKRTNDVRAAWSDEQPPPASAIYAILRHRDAGRDTASIAASLRMQECDVAQIWNVDSDNRYAERMQMRSAG